MLNFIYFFIVLPHQNFTTKMFPYAPLTSCVCRLYPNIARLRGDWLQSWFQTASYRSKKIDAHGLCLSILHNHVFTYIIFSENCIF